VGEKSFPQIAQINAEKNHRQLAGSVGEKSFPQIAQINAEKELAKIS